jgi:apolipoprotein N-acyltransferase
LRVTNTGVTAYISERGEVIDATRGFEPDVRIWTVSRTAQAKTFYTRRGDLFAALCAALGLLLLIASLRRKRAARH